MSQYDSEYYRCLVMLDVPALMCLDAYHHPEWPRQTEAKALCSMHMARVDMKKMPRKLKDYSRDWLKERGLTKINGLWAVAPPSAVVVEAVGISSASSVPGLSSRIVRAMVDALNNARAKGIVEPIIQRELMLNARAKVRFKGRHI